MMKMPKYSWLIDPCYSVNWDYILNITNTMDGIGSSYFSDVILDAYWTLQVPNGLHTLAPLSQCNVFSNQNLVNFCINSQ